ncbi:hypothetical protein GALMADRAFT_157272 [Galerina marginata CBS 339.88]|uniref:Uncharacterized protein n=1 Tax=Galerina marginata (strain CBS 339.88) TaxID=685588 RepID=A0A067T3V2_GALM3|nr:hypothetical protein GALMADRAFT_157272 [Galerina marginata CBS 339.88]
MSSEEEDMTSPESDSSSDSNSSDCEDAVAEMQAVIDSHSPAEGSGSSSSSNSDSEEEDTEPALSRTQRRKARKKAQRDVEMNKTMKGIKARLEVIPAIPPPAPMKDEPETLDTREKSPPVRATTQSTAKTPKKAKAPSKQMLWLQTTPSLPILLRRRRQKIKTKRKKEEPEVVENEEVEQDPQPPAKRRHQTRETSATAVSVSPNDDEDLTDEMTAFFGGRNYYNPRVLGDLQTTGFTKYELLTMHGLDQSVITGRFKAILPGDRRAPAQIESLTFAVLSASSAEWKALRSGFSCSD